jgi:hypothetical protein
MISSVWSVSSSTPLLPVRSTAHRQLAKVIPDRAWAQWAAQLAPVVAIEAVMAWLDADQPGPDQAADRTRQTLAGVISAACRPLTARIPSRVGSVGRAGFLSARLGSAACPTEPGRALVAGQWLKDQAADPLRAQVARFDAGSNTSILEERERDSPAVGVLELALRLLLEMIRAEVGMPVLGPCAWQTSRPRASCRRLVRQRNGDPVKAATAPCGIPVDEHAAYLPAAPILRGALDADLFFGCIQTGRASSRVTPASCPSGLPQAPHPT